MFTDGREKMLNTFARGHHAYTIGVIVYSCPFRDLKARTIATKSFFRQPFGTEAKLKLINQNIQYVSRLIIDPGYRHQGLADWLWSETLSRQTIPMIETLTTTPIRAAWLKRLGFRIYMNPPPNSIRKIKKAMHKAHLSGSALEIAEVAQKRIDRLLKDPKIKLDRSIHHFLSNFRNREHMTDGIERTMFVLSKIPYPNIYLVWFNPHIEQNPILKWIQRKSTV